jgi:hypothetical protein
MQWYEDKAMKLNEALATLGIGRRRFYELLKLYRSGTLTTLKPVRTNVHLRLPKQVDETIRAELEKEKKLIENKDTTIRTYNYQAVRDEVVKNIERSVSAQTVRNRAKDWGFFISKNTYAKKHVRVVMTTSSGLLLQHDTSHHMWAPNSGVKWSMITTLDDYSRLLLFAELFEEETSWAHIKALEAVVKHYGVGGNYYTDNHAIFRFTERTQTYWKTPKVKAEDVQTQWEQAVKATGMDIIYARSPEAKGKIERPYRWLQDRMTRACAKLGVTTIEQARLILKEEVNRYNTKQVHSTTKEIPSIRFQKALNDGNTVFRPLILPSPYTSTKDVFCLREKRKVNGYNRISWNGRDIKIPNFVPEGAEVELHIIPEASRPEVRIWYKGQLVQSVSFAPTNLTIAKDTPNTEKDIQDKDKKQGKQNKDNKESN